MTYLIIFALGLWIGRTFFPKKDSAFHYQEAPSFFKRDPRLEMDMQRDY